MTEVDSDAGESEGDGDVDPYTAEAAPELGTVRTGEDLDWRAIETYLRDGLPSDLDLSGDFEVLQFPNGAANLTYMLRFGDTELVLRRPPFGVLAPGAHDMKREYRVLSVLWKIFPKAPRAYLFCEDHEIAGADFFVMERRRGEVIRGVIPETMRGHADVARRIGFALVDAMAEFHLLNPEDVDLGGLGRPEGFVARQVSGWKKRWDLVANPKYDAEMTDLHDRLAQSLPNAQRVSFVHNDLKLDNCMFDPADPDRVTAFFDWDMTTLGDPLVDLGTLLNYWPDPSDPRDTGRIGHDGMDAMGLPSRAEMTARYGERTGLDVCHANWYAAFGKWKTATVAQQLHHRWVVGDSTDERMKTMADGLPFLLASASALLDAIEE
jgi:aminoglycoside phosphotransferase (APT) family kinase protein